MSFVIRDSSQSQRDFNHKSQHRAKQPQILQKSSVAKVHSLNDFKEMQVEAASYHIFSNLQPKTILNQIASPVLIQNELNPQILEGEEIQNKKQLSSFIFRFINCFGLSQDLVIIVLIYLDRLILRCDPKFDFSLTTSNIKNAVSGCLALTAKYHEDRFEKNTIFNVFADISKPQMKQIMNFILVALDFDLIIREQDYFIYQERLKQIFISTKRTSAQRAITNQHAKQQSSIFQRQSEHFDSSKNNYQNSTSLKNHESKSQLKRMDADKNLAKFIQAPLIDNGFLQSRKVQSETALQETKTIRNVENVESQKAKGQEHNRSASSLPFQIAKESNIKNQSQPFESYDSQSTSDIRSQEENHSSIFGKKPFLENSDKKSQQRKGTSTFAKTKNCNSSQRKNANICSIF